MRSSVTPLSSPPVPAFPAVQSASTPWYTVQTPALPCWQPEGGLSRGSSSHKVDSGQRHRASKQVLVFDEDMTLCRMVLQMLSFLGYRGVSTQNGQDALRLYCQALPTPQRFTAVILDLTVQHGHGARELLPLLHLHHPQVRAIVSSGYAQAAELTHYWCYGFAGALAKPFTLNEFAETILRAVTGSPRVS